MGALPLASPDLEAYFAPFLRDLGAANTRAVYRTGLSALLRFFDETGYGERANAGPPYPRTLLDDDLLVEFYRWLTERYSPHTTATYLAALQRFLVWLDAADALPLSFHLGKAQRRLQAARGGQKMRYRHRRPDPELPRIVTYYDDLAPPAEAREDPAQARRARLTLLRNRALVHTLYASAGRVSEVAGLTREQVLDGRAEEVYLVGKGGKERVILLTEAARRAIQAYLKARLDDYPALFIGHSKKSRGQPLHRRTIWQIVKDAARALELYENTSPHTFRHYRATQLLNKGMPLELVQAYLGHESIATTRKVYAHTHTAILKQQLRVFDESPQEALAALAAERSRRE